MGPAGDAAGQLDVRATVQQMKELSKIGHHSAIHAASTRRNPFDSAVAAPDSITRR